MYNIIYKRISKNYFLLMLVWFLSGYGFCYAQDITPADKPGFSGMVIDQYGRPISKVKVSIKKSNHVVTTDMDGSFNLDSGNGATLVLSHPDYLVKEVKVNSTSDKKKVFKVTLKDKKLKNPDTIDVPFGKTISKESHLGAISTIYTEELSSTLSHSIIPALVGRIPGLNITQNSGMRDIFTSSGVDNNAYIGSQPIDANSGYSDNTSQFGINLRGATSPVVIVDGFQSNLFNLDVESIESVSVQKDALSSMFLGGRSSRGVLYITTKKPVEGGFQVSFTGRYGIQEPIKTPKPLSAFQYAYLLNEARVNDGEKPIYSSADIEKFRNSTSPETHPNVNWYDQILKNNSAIQSYNLNATGGGKVAQYFVNLGYMSEDGLLRESSNNGYNTNLKYERYMITSKINVNVMDNLKLGASIMGRIEDGNQPGNGWKEIFNNLYSTSNIAYPIYNPNGSFGGNNLHDQNLMARTISSGYTQDITRDGTGNITLDHNMNWLLEGLSAHMVGNVAFQSRSALVRSKREPVFLYIPYANGQGGSYEHFGSTDTQINEFRGVSNYQSMYGQIALNYIKTINNAHTIEGNVFSDVGEVLDNYLLPEKPVNINVEAKYDYLKKYFAQASVSRSYSNRLAPGKRWGTFYAVGLGWDISKEAFLSDANWLDQFKLRGVFGETGNSSAGYFTWRQQYSNDINNGVWYDHGSGYGGWLAGSANGINEVDNALANPYVSWERAHKLNVGVDAALLNKSLLITADFYCDNYFDLLRQRGKTIELIGLNYPAENIGKNQYKGIDLSITYQNNVEDFNYYITGNWNIYSSKVKFMDEQNVPYDYLRRTGRPVNAIYGLVSDGFFQTEEEIKNSPVIAGERIIPGDLKYKDLNGDGVIDEFDQTVIGGDKPISYFGLNLGFEYKGFEVSALFQGVYNREIYLPDAGHEFTTGFHKVFGDYSQAYEHIINRWTPETAETALFPRLSSGSNQYNNRPNGMNNSFWLRSGNYIRLKNLNIAYTLPESLSRNYLGGAKVKIFVGGQNLWTQSATDLVDPEVMDFRNYPMLRGFNTGINIKF
ncbi:SusC/RagA family TonB-linked outer membrane protein [Dysgonomonas sp. Marseille-P4677]|uniref:SusC/RagA family TonB-linked outer membrane protein n=1 Tax=Dysgonomonas sp. Marseille-P4677 TaxID=2364790 RepID=UPI001913943B|nr:SusC/RagA family TonB-linked outer membrane protein [Dysgonomonas sp. Marseille-P4677]MBK5720017.1 SusC/RagA family TonB-linked outer membrane protein [Dysgonomonas sp. Marseille-P4677]